MSHLSEESLLKVLRSVKDPETSHDIVTAGMVSGVKIDGSRVRFVIEVEPERGTAMEPVRKAAEEAVKKLAGVTTVTAVLAAHRGAHQDCEHDHHDCGHDHHHHDHQHEHHVALEGVTHIIAVASGKGGVGKSTTAVNLAVALAANGLKVGLLDADVYGPSIPRMMGLQGKPELGDDDKLTPMENYGVKTISVGSLINEDVPMVWRGPMVHKALSQLLNEVAWGDLDVLVVDMPPGTGDAHLTLAQSVALSGVVIVTTPQDIALLDVRKGIAMFRKVDVPILGIVENMSTFICPHCGGQSDIFSHGGARREAERLGVPLLAEIPLDLAVRKTSDEGVPIAATMPQSSQAQAYLALAKLVAEALATSR